MVKITKHSSVQMSSLKILISVYYVSYYCDCIHPWFYLFIISEHSSCRVTPNIIWMQFNIALAKIIIFDKQLETITSHCVSLSSPNAGSSYSVFCQNSPILNSPDSEHSFKWRHLRLIANCRQFFFLIINPFRGS